LDKPTILRYTLSLHDALPILCTEDELPPADLPDGSVVFPDYANRGRDLEPDARSHPWWQALTERQRRMVCPADFFGQSREYRCGDRKSPRLNSSYVKISYAVI